ncbi:hypothetical protein V8G54_006779 [Vigna mungo]|uniref:Uncharacterized protein n=1 Tax=Vigna mungo TaxID=3915 RepID=A0AAQ3S6R2_VIGMU
MMWGGKKSKVVWSRGRFGLVCQGTKPHIRLVWPCGCLFEVFSPTDPLAVNKSFPCHNCYLHRHLPHSASSSASFSNGYSNSSLCHCLSSVEDRRLLQPICTHHKFIFIKIPLLPNRSQSLFFLLYKILKTQVNLFHSWQTKTQPLNYQTSSTCYPKELGDGLSFSLHDR